MNEARLGHIPQQFVVQPDTGDTEHLEESHEEVLLVLGGEGVVERPSDESDRLEEDLEECEEGDASHVELDGILVAARKVEPGCIFLLREEPDAHGIGDYGLHEAENEENEVVCQDVVNGHQVQVEVVEGEDSDLFPVDVCGYVGLLFASIFFFWPMLPAWMRMKMRIMQQPDIASPPYTGTDLISALFIVTLRAAPIMPTT